MQKDYTPINNIINERKPVSDSKNKKEGKKKELEDQSLDDEMKLHFRTFAELLVEHFLSK